MAGFPFAQQVGDSQEVVGQDGRTHEHLKRWRSSAAKEHGDAPFNASTEALPLLEGWALLLGGSFGGLLPGTIVQEVGDGLEGGVELESLALQGEIGEADWGVGDSGQGLPGWGE